MTLISTIQLTISPCLLVSAIGLLLLSMTNRYTHLTNRIRGVKLLEEKRVLYRRIRTIKYSILLALAAVLLLICLMLVFFEQLLTNRESDVLVVAIFTTALVALVISLVLFTNDMMHSLHLIHIMVKEAEAADAAEAV